MPQKRYLLQGPKDLQHYDLSRGFCGDVIPIWRIKWTRRFGMKWKLAIYRASKDDRQFSSVDSVVYFLWCMVLDIGLVMLIFVRLGGLKIMVIVPLK